MPLAPQPGAAPAPVAAPQKDTLPTSITVKGQQIPVGPNGIITMNGKSLVLKTAAFTTQGKLVGLIVGGELKPFGNVQDVQGAPPPVGGAPQPGGIAPPPAGVAPQPARGVMR